MRDDTQLTQEERYQIESLLKRGHQQSEIAVVLKRDKSTISREVRPTGVFAATARSRRSTWPWPAARPRPSQGLPPELGNGLRVCCARSGVRSRSAAAVDGAGTAGQSRMDLPVCLHHRPTQQPATEMSWLQDSKSAILRNLPTCCTYGFNPRRS